MKKEETRALRKALEYIKIARHTDHIILRMMLEGDGFSKNVIKPLEEIVGWSEQDESEVKEIAKQLIEKTKNHSLQGQVEKIIRILTYAGGIAAALGPVGGIAHIAAKRKNKDAEN